MPIRLTRPTPLVTTLLALVVLAGGLLVAATRDTGADQISVAMVTLAAAAAVAMAPLIDPAVPVVTGLVLSIFSGWWSQMGIPQGLDRPLLLYGVLIAVLGTLPDARPRALYRLWWVHWVMLATAIYALGSALFAGTLRQSEPLFALSERLGIVGFLLFATAPLIFRTAASRDLLLKALIALGAYLSVTAVMEQTALHSLVLPAYIDNNAIGIHSDRARGPFLESGADGMAMFICFVATAIGCVRWPRPRLRALFALIMVLCIVGMLLTLTRQVWVGAGAGTVVAMASTSALRRWLVPAALVLALSVAGALSLLPSLRDQVNSRANDNSSVWDRLNSDRAAIDMLQDRPILGWGWYRFAEISPQFLRQADDYPLTTVPRPHNVFLANAAELGLLGTTLWLMALLGAILTGVFLRAPPELEPWRIGLIAVSINWIVVANLTPLGYALPNHVLWLWPGIVWAGFVERTGAGARRRVPAAAAVA